jgi:hypothetical protein
MGYKIRNKSFFQTIHGFNNNYHHKILCDVLPINPSETIALQTRYDYLSFVKVLQNYRNIYRKVRQYFMGDKDLERRFLMYFKDFFRTPLTCHTPVELIPHAERRFSDQFDREWELYSYNHHPMALRAYDYNNKRIMDYAERQEIIERGDSPLDIQFRDYVAVRIGEETQKKGQVLNFEELDQVFKEGVSHYYAALGMKSVRNKSGEFEDFSENRRPYVQSKGHVETK